MSDTLEDLLKCGVCLEEYQNSGPQIPRILPCSHTVCEWCVIQLLAAGGSLKCPECKAQQAAQDRERTFPQNRYLLRLIRLRDAETSESEEESDEVRLISMALQFEVLSVKTWEMPKLTQQMITSDFEVFLPEPEILQNFVKKTGLQN